MTAIFLQALPAAADPVAETAWLESVRTFIDSPAPGSPFTEYLAVLFLLWLLARHENRKQGDFSRQAQDVLDEKLKKGEISQKAYEKYKQDISLRPKH